MHMTLTIELTAEQEAKLTAAAKATGSNPQSILGNLVETMPDVRPVAAAQQLTPAQRAEDLNAMFARWAAEDALMTPDEVEAADAGWKQIEHNLAEGGVTMRRIDVGDRE